MKNIPIFIKCLITGVHVAAIELVDWRAVANLQHWRLDRTEAPALAAPLYKHLQHDYRTLCNLL